MGWFSDQIKKRKENNQIMFENSFNDLAVIKNIVQGEEKDLRGNFICLQLIKYFDLTGADIPYSIEGTVSKIDHLIRNAGVIGRKIKISRGWNLDYPGFIHSERY